MFQQHQHSKTTRCRKDWEAHHLKWRNSPEKKTHKIEEEHRRKRRKLLVYWTAKRIADGAGWHHYRGEGSCKPRYNYNNASSTRKKKNQCCKWWRSVEEQMLTVMMVDVGDDETESWGRRWNGEVRMVLLGSWKRERQSMMMMMVLINEKEEDAWCWWCRRISRREEVTVEGKGDDEGWVAESWWEGGTEDVVMEGRKMTFKWPLFTF